MQAARDRQKSYADLKHKPMEFQVGDKVMLKVSPWKGVVHFGKRGKLNPRYVGPFKVLEKVGEVAYKLELPEELSRVHNTFHVSNMKKCHADEPLAIPLDGLHLDDKLHFVEEPVRNVGPEVKTVEAKLIPLVKVSWNSREVLRSHGNVKTNSRRNTTPLHQDHTSKCYIKRRNNFSGQKANENTECYKCGNKGHFASDCFSKMSEPSYKSPVNNYSSVSKGFQPKFTPKLIQSSSNSNN
ncbi:putative reverse transcriptase domain-containing protein [Tanacetum coccineum]